MAMSVAVITGASRGFGRALAEDLARDGWDLVIDARDERALAEAAQAVAAGSTTHRGPGARIRALPGDIADAAHRTALVAAATELGGLDLLVNNASLLGPSPQPTLDAYPLDVLETVYRVNVVAPLGLIQLALPLLVASHGTIVDVTSDAGVEGYEGWGGYGSSKAALEQLSNVLAAEQPGIHVYWFDPGDMRTRMHQEAFPGDDISDRPLPETVVPRLRALLHDAPPSGRYRAADLIGAIS
jgi:NAD(P)-dependent dehydrogenase (short-subunit alcohol dehydrogenase family)